MKSSYPMRNVLKKEPHGTYCRLPSSSFCLGQSCYYYFLLIAVGIPFTGAVSLAELITVRKSRYVKEAF